MKNCSGGLFVIVSSYWYQVQIYVGILALVRLFGWEEIKMKCSKGINEMSGLRGGGGVGQAVRFL